MKTDKSLKRIEKLLKSHNLSYEILGNQIDTLKCTIEVWKDGIRVNEEHVVDLDDMLFTVLAIEQG